MAVKTRLRCHTDACGITSWCGGWSPSSHLRRCHQRPVTRADRDPESSQVRPNQSRRVRPAAEESSPRVELSDAAKRQDHERVVASAASGRAHRRRRCGVRRPRGRKRGNNFRPDRSWRLPSGGAWAHPGHRDRRGRYPQFRWADGEDCLTEAQHVPGVGTPGAIQKRTACSLPDHHW